jgi:chromosome segregation ATPase
MGVGSVPAGWYPDNQNAALLRWWDGAQWTAHAQPRAGSVPVSPSPQPAGPAGAVTAAAATQPASGRHEWHSGSKRDLQAEVDRLRQALDGLGVTEREQLAAEVTRLRDDVARLRRDEAGLSAVVGPLRAELAALGSQRALLVPLQAEVQQLQQRRDALKAETAGVQRVVAETRALLAERAELSGQLVEMREMAILQEAGVYQYRHPLDDALAYKPKLAAVQARIKDAVKAGNAVKGATNWTVNGSAAAGAKMVREFSKLMLRAYNNEADNAVRSMKPYTLESSVARVQKARETITRLGGTMNIRITDSYHGLRVEELELTADYLAKVAEEKDRAREERARLREEEIARREYEREQERLRKELAHYETAITALRGQGDDAGASQAEVKLTEIRDALDGINRRAANIRAGHVYVISNIGAFGVDIVKIGMTRRLEPMDRVRELGDASVPFHYDVHAMVFSDDAVGLENHLHHQLADRRLNLVNMRREFFRAHPAEVRDILARLDASIVRWVDEPEALEWRQSQQARRQHDAPELSARLPV